ncbi:MAG: DUF6468 domain-containing protein [Alphaproteobacteria bacterium]
MSVELFINIVVICLLVPTIIFAIILNKRLEVLRNSRADLGRLIEAFNDATTRAESGIPRLKQAADSAGSLLREQIQKAQTLRDDMAFMIERADTIVQRLEDSMRAVPSVARPVDSPVNPVEEAKAAPSFASKPKKKRVLAENPEDLISSAVSAAQDILRDVEEAKTPKTAKKAFVSLPEEEIDPDRSEAERELLKALQSMR